MAGTIRAVLFDFGGVVAEEGFRDGLKIIAGRNGLDPDAFFRAAEQLIYDSGYLTGKADEGRYWQALRESTGIRGIDRDLRAEILERFRLRPGMISLVDRVRKVCSTMLLSDQTNWLEEIDRTTGLYTHFDRVFNSIRIGMSKREPETFTRVAALLRIPPAEMLFIDDNEGHVARAASAGYRALLFTTLDSCEQDVLRMTGIE